MGFMDKFKDAAQQAQGATKADVTHPAILRGMRETQTKDPLSGGTEYELEVEVRPTGGEAYTATFSQQLIAQSVHGHKEKIGGEIVVNVDPDDPQSMLLWG